MINWKEQFKSDLSADELEEILTDYFKFRFREEDCVGAVILHSGWCDGDRDTPFFGLCSRLARLIRKKHQFRPFIITINGSKQRKLGMGSSTSQYGLRTEYRHSMSEGACHLAVELINGTSEIIVHYSWPEPYAIQDENGLSNGGSHSVREYHFDLNDPGSINKLTDVIIRRCDDMLAGGKCRPSS